MRLIDDPPLPGAENMSLDEALLHAVAAGASPNTLRFYRWSEPTLSLGYFQRLHDRQLHNPSLNCALVRRSSGGGAILHHHELTYSIALRVNDRFASAQLYTLVHEALLQVLANWSIRAELVSGPRSESATEFLCFARRSPGDVILSGYKICGSAQRRVGAAVLQHGSLLLSQSAYAPELPGLLELSALSPDDLASLAKAWKTALESRLGDGPFSVGKWTVEEQEAAERWNQERYGENGWISRR
jgi:lipoate-protein ligase A